MIDPESAPAGTSVICINDSDISPITGKTNSRGRMLRNGATYVVDRWVPVDPIPTMLAVLIVGTGNLAWAAERFQKRELPEELISLLQVRSKEREQEDA